jgi:aerobic carbon-monoxide dehydrogenase medium subunit
MSVLPPFGHSRPGDLSQALTLVGSDDVPYSGGTELLLAMRAGLFRPSSLVDLKRVPELQAIGIVDDVLRIGGGVTHRSAIESPVVAEASPVLVEVLRGVGNPRVRAAGTLGGNLCFAEPKSDVGTILLALDASVELSSSAGTREVPVAEFFEGPYATVRADDEILTAILFPVGAERRVHYEKFATMERPTAGIAGVRYPDGRTRVVVGAAGPTPQSFEFSSPETVDVASIVASLEIIPDAAGGDRYKRHIVSLLIDRTLAQLREVM